MRARQLRRRRAAYLALAAGVALIVLGWIGRLAGLGAQQSQPAAVLWSAFAMSLLLGLLAFGLAIGMGGSRPLARLGLGRGQLSSRVLALLVLGVLALSLAADASLRESGLRERGTLARLDQAVEGAGCSWLLKSAAALALAPALGEELFFRGLLQRSLEVRLGPGFAIPLASLAFAAVHGDAVHALAAFVLGLYLGAVAYLSASVRGAILCHAANNLAAVGFGASGLGDLSLPSAAIPALLALAVAALWVARRAAARAR